MELVSAKANGHCLINEMLTLTIFWLGNAVSAAATADAVSSSTIGDDAATVTKMGDWSNACNMENNKHPTINKQRLFGWL